MTTSGSTDFNFNRDQIIKRSLRQCGAFASGETPDAQTVQDASDCLNAMIKGWDATGIHVWTESEAILFLQPSQAVYIVGAGSTDHCADLTNPSALVQTTTSLAAVLGASVIKVTSATGITTGQNIGVVLAGGSIQWTTVNGAPSGTNVTLAAVLTDAVPAGASVFVYPSGGDIIRPLRVPMARRFNYASLIETPMYIASRADYNNLPNKLTTGIATQMFYDPRGGANTQGVLKVWPVIPVATDAVKFTWYRTIQDFDSAANTSDLPLEWLNAIIWNLSLELAPEYDVTQERMGIINARAAYWLDVAMGWDREPESTYFGVNFDQR